MKPATLLLIGALAAVVVTSCKTAPTSPITIESYPKTKIIMNSKILAGWFEIVEYNAMKRDSGLLEVQISLLNRKSRGCQFEYRFRWLDKNGMAMAERSSLWVPKSIMAKEKMFVNGVAPNKDVEDFVLDVRFTHSSTEWTVPRDRDDD